MRRTDRLFKIIQILRRRRRPITGRELAVEMERERSKANEAAARQRKELQLDVEERKEP